MLFLLGEKTVPDGVRLPAGDHAGWLDEVQLGLVGPAETSHEHAEAERSGASCLGVLLDDLRDVARHELD